MPRVSDIQTPPFLENYISYTFDSLFLRTSVNIGIWNARY